MKKLILATLLVAVVACSEETILQPQSQASFSLEQPTELEQLRLVHLAILNQNNRISGSSSDFVCWGPGLDYSIWRRNDGSGLYDKVSHRGVEELNAQEAAAACEHQ